MEYRTLGKTDIKVSQLGFGTLTMGFSQKNLSYQEGAALIEYAVRRGVNFLDTAEYYDTYPYIRPALDRLKADGVAVPVISSKSLAGDYDGMRKAVEESLSALDLPYIDIFLLHEVMGMDDFAARSGAWEALKDCKKEGLIKAMGVSTHHIDVAEGMACEEACDVLFPLINVNSLGIRHYSEAGTKEDMETAIKACADQGIGIFTMKAFGGGNLTKDYVKCLDYASAIPGSSAVMIGLASEEQIDKAIAYFDGVLARDYEPDTSDKLMIVEKSDCIGCGCCIKRCNNKAIHWGADGLAEIDQTKCLKCGYCGPVCPMRAIILL
jgi:aryl-alcohol dehydrogenase-like predicted oxidoreductase